MQKIKVEDQPKLLREFVDSLSQASGACSQLLHLRRDPRWMIIREALELTQEGILEVVTFATKKVGLIKPS